MKIRTLIHKHDIVRVDYFDASLPDGPRKITRYKTKFWTIGRVIGRYDGPCRVMGKVTRTYMMKSTVGEHNRIVKWAVDRDIDLDDMSEVDVTMLVTELSMKAR